MIGQLQKISFIVKGSRTISTSSVLKKRYTPVENPGVYRRLKAVKKDEADIIEKSSLDLEALEEMEENLWNADHMHDEIIGDIKKIQSKREFKIIERKYFKPPKEPSMLSWAEREQIKFLNQSDPEKWSPESLAASFPASPSIIRKILKSTWKPKSAEIAKELDRTVSKNWIAFHRGQLEVHDPQLKQHLQKFTDRKNGVQIISDEDAKKAADIILPKPKKTEFLSLITSFKSKKEGENETDQKKIENKKQIFEREQKMKEHSTTHYTLDELSRKLNKENDPGGPSDEGIMRISQGSKVPTNTSQRDLPYMAP